MLLTQKPEDKVIVVVTLFKATKCVQPGWNIRIFPIR